MSKEYRNLFTFGLMVFFIVGISMDIILGSIKEFPSFIYTFINHLAPSVADTFGLMLIIIYSLIFAGLSSKS
ncbi:MAG: hypothetical protein QF824_04490 [Candidatus Woesearchaeota archaeon]|jgi:hypothetical protein|nr:hypothetical protein [Candidatus Woesearchaeota archaeon]